ncbi:MAG: asparagine synthase [Bdellovibrionales bacterium]|nr:asparagine synthase [Bdellovibrionales bacterium]
MSLEENSYNEADTARYTANHFNVPHQKIDFSSDVFASVFSDTVYFSDNLAANTSMFPNYYLSQHSGAEVKVALDGGGGDELFFGYPTYKADFYMNIARHLPFKKEISKLVQHLPVSHEKLSFDYKLKKFCSGLEFDHKKAHYWWRTIITEKEKFDLLHTDRSFPDTYQSYETVFKNLSNLDAFEQFSYADLQVWWISCGLYQADSMGMANSLEIRVPMMDHEFVELAYQIPVKYKLSHFKTKPLLRKLSERWLPEKIISLKKSGFHIPLASWFCKELKDFVEENLSYDRIMAIDFLNYSEITKLKEQHFQKKTDNSYKLINLMVLVEWYHLFILRDNHNLKRLKIV